jgi:hypothetical protein
MSQENVEIVSSIYTAFAQRDGVKPFSTTHPTSNGIVSPHATAAAETASEAAERDSIAPSLAATARART